MFKLLYANFLSIKDVHDFLQLSNSQIKYEII